ncbi:MAG: hypothetical protein ACJ744_11160 [Gaiellaceae bacterium]
MRDRLCHCLGRPRALQHDAGQGFRRERERGGGLGLDAVAAGLAENARPLARRGDRRRGFDVIVEDAERCLDLSQSARAGRGLRCRLRDE